MVLGLSSLFERGGLRVNEDGDVWEVEQLWLVQKMRQDQRDAEVRFSVSCFSNSFFFPSLNNFVLTHLTAHV